MGKTLSKSLCLMAAAALVVPSMSAQKAKKASAAATQPSRVTEMVQKDTKAAVPFWNLPVRSSKSSSSQIKSAATNLLKAPRTYNPLRTDNLVTLRGNVCFSEQVDGANVHLGMYEFTSTGVFTELARAPQVQFSAYGQILLDDTYYLVKVVSFLGMNIPYIYTYDATTWTEISNEQVDVAMVASALSQDPATGNVYGVFYNADGSGFEFGQADLANKTRTTITALPGNVNALAFDNSGQGYVIDYDGNLQKIDKATGAMTLVGATGYVPKYLTGGCVDQKTNKMYWTLCPEDETGNLMEVDLTTGAATLLHQFVYCDEIAGIWVPFIANDNAPAAPENVAVNFANGSMSGTVSFKAPTTLFDGTPATGNVSWKVLANGEQVANGTCAYGANVSENLTMTAAGMYTFMVVLTNDGGDSPKVKVEQFVGMDSPKAPANVTLTRENDSFVITWDPVTETVNGGYMDVAQVRYKLVRFPDEMTVAEDLNATTFTDNVPVPDTYTTYYYTVQAFCGENESGISESNKLALGEIGIPYYQDFAEESSMEQFTVIDANEDGKTWTWYDGKARVKWNSQMAMDDWLILPKLKFESGKVYPFQMKATASTSYDESVQVCLGNAPTAAAMTTVVTELLNFKGEQIVVGYITVPSTGDYYVGIHGCSDADKFNLDVDDISVEAGFAGTTPNQVTDINIQPAAYGELKATVSFTTPTVTFANAALTSLTKIEVARDDEIIKTFDNPAVGAALSFEDVVPADGDYTYKFIPYNADGAGRAATATAYIGVQLPAAPENATIVETTPGTVKVTWTPVTEDINGNPLNASQVTYVLVDAQNTATVYAEDITGSEWTIDEIVPENEQDLVAVGVFAKTAKGTGQGIATDLIPVGTPYTIPMIESFPDGTLSYVFGMRRLNGSNITWQICKDDTFTDLTSADEDNGYLDCAARAIDESSLFFSGKVDLTAAVNPAFSFRTYNIVGENGNPDDNIIEIVAREVGAEEWTVVKSGDVNTLCNGIQSEWSGPIICNMNAFVGKTIQWGIRVTVKSYAHTMFDELKLAELLDHNLTAGKLYAPVKVNPNTEFGINFDVTNNGSLAASDYTVVLTDGDGNELETLNGVELESGETTTYNFTRSFSPCDEAGARTYGAKIVWAADEAPTDNVATPIEVLLVLSSMPAPRDLTATNNGQGYARLDWAAPEIPQGGAETVTESFEEFDSFALEGQKGWTFVDMDGSPVGGFQGVDVPNITPGQTTAGFFVFDSTPEQFNQSFDAQDGDKYLAALFRYDDGQSDDWAISPVLSGNEQTITFWARSYSTSYPEKIEVYYTDGESVDPNDYTVVDGSTVNAVPGTWTEYTVDLPAGAKHFAIRSFATGSFMLMLDNVTMEIDPTATNDAPRLANYTCTGYNIYRDGVKINDAPVTATTYDDTTAAGGEHRYNVTALYSNGKEGPVSNTATFTVGVEGIGADALAINVENNMIVVANAAGLNVTINAANGAVIYKGIGDARVEVAAGVYVVKAGKEVAKVIVK